MSPRVNVRKYAPDDKPVWDKFIREAKNSTFLFDRNFMDYHGDRIKDHSLLLFVDDVLRSVMPANENGDQLISHGGLSYGGLVLEKSVRLDEVLSFFFYILKYADQQGIKKVVYKCMPSYFAQAPSFEDQYALFLLNASLDSRSVSSVCTQPPGISFRQTKRNTIRHASSDGLKVSETKNPAGFWTLLEDNLRKRHGVAPAHSLADIRLLMSRFPENIRCFEVTAGELLGGTIIFDSTTTAHAQYVSSNEEGKRRGALDLLFYELITETFAHKPFFSFGISNVNKGRELNRGLNNWKEGFGARSHLVDAYSIEVGGYSLLRDYA